MSEIYCIYKNKKYLAEMKKTKLRFHLITNMKDLLNMLMCSEGYIMIYLLGCLI